jgi:FtsP/CotA-like multicopper oxidase with cupredoxin domain
MDLHHQRELHRREFLRMSAVVAGGSMLAACGDGPELEPGLDTSASALKPAPAATRNPLFLPPTVSPVGGLLLTAAPGIVDLGGGKTSTALAYNGSFPGPTILARRGDPVTIRLINGLAQETITHWHGMLVDQVNDGHPRFAILPGGSYDYAFTISQRACLNWYHPHPDTLTGEQVNLGLAGAFIIRDAEEDALSLPSGNYEVPLIVRDATLDRAGNLAYAPRNGGFDGRIPLVNGTREPRLEIESTLYRFRILNGANARIFDFVMSNGAPFTLIGNDGGLLETPAQLTQLTAAPAERFDVLVDFSAVPIGQSVMLRDQRSGWNLLELKVVARGASSVPTLALPSIPKLTAPVRTRQFSFDGMSRINGQVYDLSRIDFSVPFGETERWIFTTNGNAPHPVHVHGASYQVQSRTGGRGTVFPWERGWKDTVLLEDNETVEVLIRFDAYRGIYLLHCHKLEHEDMGMMANFEVV